MSTANESPGGGRSLDPSFANERVTVIVERDYPARRTAIGWFSPLIFVVTVLFVAGPIIYLAGSNILAGVVATVLAEVAFILISLRLGWLRKDWVEALDLYKPSRKAITHGLLAGIILLAGLQVVAKLVELTGSEVTSSETSMQLTQSSGFSYYLLMFFLVPFVVPIVEELTFRGVILGAFMQSSIRPKLNVFIGVAFSSIFFALMHAQGFSSVSDILIIIWIGVVAVVASLMRLKFGTIYSSFALHISYNLTTVVLSMAAGLS